MLRFAPSPTGDMHVGNLRVAIFNYIVARQKGEKLLIRIEDTDKERNIEGKDKEILDILNLFGIKYDQVVYQSSNFHIHQQMAKRLLENKKAFVCFCDEEELNFQREKAKLEKRPYRYSGKCENLTKAQVEELMKKKKPFVIRIKKPENDIEFKDLIKGDMKFTPFEVDSFVILRGDYTPTYNFACAIDDMLYDISLVIRGEDHLSNTPKQIHIRNSLGYDKEIKYAHLPIILNEEGKKLSKRENHASVKWLLEEGYLPEAIANYLILLGNSFEREVFTLEEAIEFFDLTKISRSPAKFDIEKLKFLNKEHMKRLKELHKIIGAHPSYEKLLEIFRDESDTLKEIKEKFDKIFKPAEDDEFKEQREILKEEILKGELEENYDEFKKRLMKNTGLKGKNLFMPLRELLINQKHGAEIKDLYSAMKPYLKEVIKTR
ncbi:glutamate--tRNA ligase [Caminibacter pacificus]|uniref:Glutamate--tRNA ligase n=1 Tax=Caminibacter pacificus TaxID=1424653 RepID=A0AAJ4REQ4_9BACT|nr:glutamate--tRNA ligase [Caminibacter pacificus]QCI28063.1 glutamate--tRNA ligase [Caminibacter pacificus]ROR41229.1 glutamate--tRNA(Gln) ligase [Caminibacter pacificus]